VSCENPGVTARPLLTVKQVIPPVRAGAVGRERLAGQLRRADTPLTVVVAPAGWGKTSLLSGWANDPAEKRRIAWVSLDESDDEPVRFWSYVLTALHGAGLSDEPLRALDAAEVPPIDLAVPLLLNELASMTGRIVLVLDDYHLITDPRIHEAIEFLVAYLPPALRLTVAGRADPPLPLARLRARGDLTELRAAQLRFSRGEAAELVSAMAGVELPDAVFDRTEGWAAGLQLAALAMRTDSARVGADGRHLLDYFAAEVLPGLAPAHRELLVRAAPLELLSGPLCDAALDVTGSARVLDELVRADLFVAALGGEWFRCHRLLRDALLRSSDSDPAEVLERAAGWFEAQDRIDDAVDHLQRAGRFDAAGSLMVRHAESWFLPRGAVAVYLRLGAQLPVAGVSAELAMSLAYAAALRGDRPEVNRWLDIAEDHARPDTAIAGWNSFRAALLSVRATFGLSDLDAARSVELATEAIALETAGGSRGHPSVRPALGAALGRDGRFSDASDLLMSLWTSRERDSWPFWIVLQVGGTLAFMLNHLGRDAECDLVLREVAPIAAEIEEGRREASAPGLAGMRITQARRRYQRGDVDAAAVLLHHAVDLAALHPRPTMTLMALLYLADAELARGDRAAARVALARAREVVEDEPVSVYARRLLEESENRMGRGAARAANRTGALAEELTDRELSILRALQGTASQREIGAALFLSINTVKAYTKSLYRKLGVASRQEAVATARQLGLI